MISTRIRELIWNAVDDDQYRHIRNTSNVFVVSKTKHPIAYNSILGLYGFVEAMLLREFDDRS